MGNTNVTAIVTDSDGIAWIYGAWKAVLTNADGSTPIKPVITATGAAVGLVLSGELDNTGKFVVLFSDNNTITPPGTFWRFTIQPLASVPPSVVDVVITGGSMNISSLLTSKISAPRFALTGDSFGYADIEVSPPPVA